MPIPAENRGAGKSRREIIRCLERHIAREIYRLLTNPPAVPHGADLRRQRHHARITFTAATALGTHPTRISALERGAQHNHPLEPPRVLRLVSADAARGRSAPDIANSCRHD